MLLCFARISAVWFDTIPSNFVTLYSYSKSTATSLLFLRSSAYYLDIVKEALRVCGHNPDLVQVVTGFGETGAALTKSGVDKITFIGSPEVGKYVMRDAADTLTPVVLELGGKDAAVVCDDCDFDQVGGVSVLVGCFEWN